MSLANIAALIAQKLPTVLRGESVRKAAGVAGTLVAGGMIDDLFDPGGAFGARPKKRRRMNYGNARAARRAIRRIKGTRKLLQDIEKQLPRKTVQRRAKADLGPGHTHVR